MPTLPSRLVAGLLFPRISFFPALEAICGELFASVSASGLVRLGSCTAEPFTKGDIG